MKKRCDLKCYLLQIDLEKRGRRFKCVDIPQVTSLVDFLMMNEGKVQSFTLLMHPTNQLQIIKLIGPGRYYRPIKGVEREIVESDPQPERPVDVMVTEDMLLICCEDVRQEVNLYYGKLALEALLLIRFNELNPGEPVKASIPLVCVLACLLIFP